MLEIKNVKKSFKNLEVLKDVSLDIDDGHLTLGEKSVSLKKANKKQINELRKNMAFVFQNYNLFANKTVFMDGGVVVEEGKPDEILVSPKEERTKEFLARVLPKDMYYI